MMSPADQTRAGLAEIARRWRVPMEWVLSAAPVREHGLTPVQNARVRSCRKEMAHWLIAVRGLSGPQAATWLARTRWQVCYLATCHSGGWGEARRRRAMAAYHADIEASRAAGRRRKMKERIFAMRERDRPCGDEFAEPGRLADASASDFGGGEAGRDLAKLAAMMWRERKGERGW